MESGRRRRAFSTLPAAAGAVCLAIAFWIWWDPRVIWWMFILLFAGIGAGLLVFALKQGPKPTQP